MTAPCCWGRCSAARARTRCTWLRRAALMTLRRPCAGAPTAQPHSIAEAGWIPARARATRTSAPTPDTSAALRRSLRSGNSAIHVENLAGDEIARRRAEEKHRPRHIARLGDAAERDALLEPCTRLRILQPVRAHLGAHHRRRHAVHADAARPELGGVLLHEHHQPALGRAVGGVAASPQAELRAHREQVHLLAAAL